MSYNCDTWITKKLANFSLPVASLFMSDRTVWHPKREINWDDSVLYAVDELSWIEGREDESGQLHVDAIEICGECSGTAMELVFEPAFKESTGELVASLEIGRAHV